MKNLNQGENVSLFQSGILGRNIFSGISWRISGGEQLDIDVCAFLLNSRDKVSDDDGFVFYNQKEDAAKSILLNTEPENGNDIQLFSIRLDNLPPDVKKIVFVASIDKASERFQNFGKVKDLCIRVFEPDAFNERTILFKINQADKETSIALGELYLYQSTWKFRGLGQGFESGLEALARSYGINIASDASQANEKQGSSQQDKGDRFIDQALIENEIHINKHIHKILPIIKNAVE